MANPAGYTDASTKWNSFSRIDVVKHTSDISKTGFRDLASILIDADALTPILKWNGSFSDREWLKGYMDYMPYEMSKMNHSSTLVIGSGGEDILVALSAGSKNVTAVELNPLIVAGKEVCEQKHGPYYYAYWKDPESKKLKKKYIGNHKPDHKELKNDCNNDKQIL